MIRYLDLEELLQLCNDISVGPVRDMGLLESALARPQTTLMGVDAYESIDAKAASLLHSLVCNHALVDGNKRIGWFATVVFLALNTASSSLTQDEAFELVMSVAAGDIRDVVDIAAALRAVPLR